VKLKEWWQSLDSTETRRFSGLCIFWVIFGIWINRSDESCAPTLY